MTHKASSEFNRHSPQSIEEKIRALVLLSKKLQQTDPRRAHDCAAQALTLIGNRDDLPKEKADALLSKGNALRGVSEYSGNVFESLGDFACALSHHQESYRLSQAIGDKEGVAFALLRLGNGFSEFNQKDDALRAFQQGLMMGLEIGSKNLEANFCLRLGKAHAKFST